MKYTNPEGTLSIKVAELGAYLQELEFKGVNYLAERSFIGEKVRGESHSCLPVFGLPKAHSSLFGKMPGHGEFRRTLFNSQRIPKGIVLPFILSPEKGDAYRWPLEGLVNYEVFGNELRTNVRVRRGFDGIKGLAPINIADHPYWKRYGAIEVKMGSFEMTIDRPIPDALKIPYTGIVSVHIAKNMRVELEMIGNSLIKPQLVLWSDSNDYACVELAMTHPALFDSPNGAFLKEGGETIKVTFIKRLFVE